jgi:hypothetical protein
VLLRPGPATWPRQGDTSAAEVADTIARGRPDPLSRSRRMMPSITATAAASATPSTIITAGGHAASSPRTSAVASQNPARPATTTRRCRPGTEAVMLRMLAATATALSDVCRISELRSWPGGRSTEERRHGPCLAVRPVLSVRRCMMTRGPTSALRFRRCSTGLWAPGDGKSTLAAGPGASTESRHRPLRSIHRPATETHGS